MLDQVKGRLRLLHYALSTEDIYCHWIGRYYEFCLELPRELEPERKVEAFLTDLAVRLNVAARTQNQAFAAVLFLYKEVLEKPLGEIHALRAKRPFHERVSPSRDRVRQLRGAMEDTELTPTRLLVDLLYGCGMRVSEPVELRIKDVLWDEGATGHLVIRGAKGGKDRRVPIPSICVAPLKAQIIKAKGIWDRDRRDSPCVGVTLPGRLHIKYPSAPFLWQWFWVFPAANHCNDPRLNVQVLRAKLLLTRSCHKLERTVYERPSSGLSMGRMTSFMVQDDPPSRFLGVDLSTLAAELGRLPEKG